MEAGVVLGLTGEPIYWHVPQGRTEASLPDSHDLWMTFWDNRDNLSGFAHSHPGSGVPGPSYEDVTTFAAVEKGLGARLEWWIITRDRVAVVWWEGPGRLDYKSRALDPGNEPDWAPRLRDVSYGKEIGS